jgi:hypothetical protein
MLEVENSNTTIMLDIRYSDVNDKINLHSIFLSRLKDRSDDLQGRLEFDFQKNWIILTSYNGYGYLKNKIKCENEDFDKKFLKPIAVDIKDVQSLVKSFDVFKPDLIILDCSDSTMGFRLPSTSSKKVKNSIRIYDDSFGRLVNREKIRSIENIDVDFFSNILSRIISINLFTDSGSYFDFLNFTIDDQLCRATSGNGSFFSSISWGKQEPFIDSGSWSLSIVAVAMMLKITKKSKSSKLSIIEYRNCIKFKLDSFEIVSLDKFDSRWPDVNSIIKRNNDVVVSIDSGSAKSVRDFLIPVLDQAQRDKVEIPSVSLSFDLSDSPSIEIQSNFKKETYFTLDKNFVSVETNESRASVFNCNVSLKSLITSLSVGSNTEGVEFKLSEESFNGHSSPVLIEHVDSDDCQFSSFFAQVE